MKRSLLASILTIPLAFAGPFDPSTIPADANWYLHGDLSAMRETTTGGIIFEELQKTQADQLAEVKNFLNLDLLTDLDDVTLFGNGKEDQAAITLTGKFDRSHLEALIQEGENYKSTAHGKTVIHQWDDKGKTQFAAFHSDKTVTISQQLELLKTSLDVFAKNKPSLAADFPLPAKSPAIVAFANLKEIDMPLEDGSRIVRKADSILMTLSENEERLIADMEVQSKNWKSSRRIMHVLQGLIALGELADEKIDDLDIQHRAEAKGKTLTMSMSLPTAKALALLSKIK